MFEDSLFDSGAGRRPRKAWTKFLSFAIEVCAVGVLVLVPLIYTQALPKQLWTSMLEAPTPPPGPAPPQILRSQPRMTPTSREFVDNVLREPSQIPRSVAMKPEESMSNEGPPSLGNFVQGGTGEGVANSVITEIARATPPAVRTIPPQKLRVSSGVAAGMLVHQVKPQYPELAMKARIQGTVVLQAVIGKDGTVQDLRLVSGHPMLAPAAIEAVRQWRYRPYLLNNEPVEVDTQINVNFTLGGG